MRGRAKQRRRVLLWSISLLVVASMVCIDRFATPDSVVNYYGVFPEENSSGFDKRGKRVPPGTMQMCKKGNDLVRKLLYMSCLSAIKTNPADKKIIVKEAKEEEEHGNVTLRRTTIEEIEIHDTLPPDH